MAFLFACPCKNCDHAPSQHADLLDAPSSTDHCTVEGCNCEDYEPSCRVCDGCRKMALDLGEAVHAPGGDFQGFDPLAARVMHVHHRATRHVHHNQVADTVDLEAEWLSGEKLNDRVRVLRWVFQQVTRVGGFEVRPDPRGELLSIRCGVEEQLMTAGKALPMVEAAQFNARRGLWVIGPLQLPTLAGGQHMTIIARDFDGAELRPFGRQLR